jgi:hypothetical protein
MISEVNKKHVGRRKIKFTYSSFSAQSARWLINFLFCWKFKFYCMRTLLLIYILSDNLFQILRKNYFLPNFQNWNFIKINFMRLLRYNSYTTYFVQPNNNNHESLFRKIIVNQFILMTVSFLFISLLTIRFLKNERRRKNVYLPFPFANLQYNVHNGLQWVVRYIIFFSIWIESFCMYFIQF